MGLRRCPERSRSGSGSTSTSWSPATRSPRLVDPAPTRHDRRRAGRGDLVRARPRQFDRRAVDERRPGEADHGDLDGPSLAETTRPQQIRSGRVGGRSGHWPGRSSPSSRSRWSSGHRSSPSVHCSRASRPGSASRTAWPARSARCPSCASGIFAPLAPLLAGDSAHARRSHPSRSWSSASGCAASVPGPGLVLALTFGVGLGMGLAGPIFPLVVRRGCRLAGPGRVLTPSASCSARRSRPPSPYH